MNTGLVGIKDTLLSWREIKRCALMFDHVLLAAMPWTVPGRISDYVSGERIGVDEASWLSEEGFIKPVCGFDEVLRAFENSRDKDAVKEALLLFMQGSVLDGYARVVAAKMRLLEEGDPILLLPPMPASDVMDEDDSALRDLLQPQQPSGAMIEGDSLTNTVQVVINNLPVPDDTTPWEAIAEFRSDPKSMGQFIGLRRWMRQFAEKDQPAHLIQEELEYLLHEYRAHMELHRMKANAGALETVVTVSAELAENLTKLRFGMISKLLFAGRQRKLALMEAERNAPGRDLAYIVAAQSRFASSARQE